MQPLLCCLALAISCGARISELARFTTDLIDEDNVVFDGLFLETTKEIVRMNARILSFRELWIPEL